MRRSTIVFIILFVYSILLTSCSDPDKAKREELYHIFIVYAQYEEPSEPDPIIDAFKKDLQLFLDVLAYTRDKQPSDLVSKRGV